ncbi:MAG: hypothetical protein PHQ46_11860 [Negativicutes bacterium]|nr:hypothetical protein [Negativicutes bacterium]
MIGYPKKLNSKFDYEFIRENFPRERWEGAYRALLDERLQWFCIGKINNGEDGAEDETHKIITTEQNDSTEKYQYELREDPNCSLLRLGFTVEEVEAILKQEP